MDLIDENCDDRSKELGRLFLAEPAQSDLEGIVAWCFHQQETRVGTRVETTAYGGIIVALAVIQVRTWKATS